MTTSMKMSGVRLYQYVIYKNPTDYPGKFVVRKWSATLLGIEPLHVVAVVDTLEEARRSIPAEADYPLNRCPQDDPCIVEVWI